ncbi:MAG: CHASE2 domain-containing protein [Leptolyngbya sp. SIO4C1]|nr:CHASE2 domain-containing protein [Leptolyngbya sp. SIO4C1]
MAFRTRAWELMLEGRLGLGIIGVIVGLRLLGLFQFLELLTLDRLQQLSFSEPTDPHITLIGIDEAYLKHSDTAFLQYTDLAKLLETILVYQPTVVGVDMVIDDLSGTEKSRLLKLFEENEHLLTVEKVRPPMIAPLEGLSEEVVENQVGFNDFSLDDDGNVRRMFLGWTPIGSLSFRKSLALLLAERYLYEHRGLELENGIRDPDAMRFGDVEIPRLDPNAGGYFKQSSVYGIQTLINFRSGLISGGNISQPFKILKASDVVKSSFSKEDISQKIVILGLLDPSNVIKFGSAVPLRLIYNKDRLTGLELQAHAASQITSAVINGSPLIWFLSTPLEYAFIVVFGIAGISIKKAATSTLNGLLCLVAVGFLLILTSYWSLTLGGLWLPAAPALLALVINGVAYVAVAQSENRWQVLVQERDIALAALKLERQKTIEHAFDTIHNGPLQTLANLLRLIRDNQISTEKVGDELKRLNQEIRDIGESLKQDAISDDNLYIKVGNSRLDLSIPLHELFYEIYRETLERPFPGFQMLKIQARSLEPIEPENLTIECKRKLCRFFEETLCNVGRHAIGATRLTVTGKTIEKSYCLRIVDNGSGLQSPKVSRGRGTKIACELEAVLKGKFIRKNNYPRGVFCEFRWVVS